MFQDMDKLIVGIILMFVYMQVVLSKFSWVELRVRTALHKLIHRVQLMPLPVPLADAGQHGTI